MDTKKLIAAIIAVVLGLAGVYFGVDFKGAFCGPAPVVSAPVVSASPSQ